MTRSLERRLVAWQALQDAMPVFPVYALLFADAGLSLQDISLLFVLWSVVGIVLEIPSGAWADTVSRRGLLAAGAVTYGAAFACWVLVPTAAGFAAGFVLWGLSGALTSGTFEALAYDELAARGARHRYARVLGTGHAAAVGAMTLATLAAAPLLAVGGYPLVGWLSVAVCAVQLGVVLSLPSAPRTVAVRDVEELDDTEGPDGPGGRGATPDRPRTEAVVGVYGRWLRSLRAGVSEAGTSGLVRGAVLAAGVVLALEFLDEYFGLLLREQGAALVLVPVLVGVIGAGEVAGALLGPRAARWRSGAVGAAVTVAGAALVVAVLVGRPVVTAAVLAVGYGLVRLAVVVTEVRLQDAVRGPARATVVSTSNVLAESLAVLAYAGFALASDDVGGPVLVVGVVVVVLGLAVRRWLPARAPAAG